MPRLLKLLSRRKLSKEILRLISRYGFSCRQQRLTWEAYSKNFNRQFAACMQEMQEIYGKHGNAMYANLATIQHVNALIIKSIAGYLYPLDALQHLQYGVYAPLGWYGYQHTDRTREHKAKTDMATALSAYGVSFDREAVSLRTKLYLWLVGVIASGEKHRFHDSFILCDFMQYMEHMAAKNRPDDEFIFVFLSVCCYYGCIQNNAKVGIHMGDKGNIRAWLNERFTRQPAAKNSEPVINPYEQEMKNILSFADELLKFADSSKPETLKPIFTFIKMFTDYVSLDFTIDTLHEKEQSSFNVGYESLYQQVGEEAASMQRIIANVDIDLATDPVLTFPWKAERITRNLLDLAGPDIQWVEQGDHAVTLWLPIGVTIVESGNHSILTGLSMREGKFRMDSRNNSALLEQGIIPNREVYSLSGLYPVLEYTGFSYRNKNADRNLNMFNQTVASAKKAFELGCLFEIGRRMDEKGICFLDYKQGQRK